MDRGIVRKRAVGLLSVAAAAAVTGVLPATASTSTGSSFVGGLTVSQVASTIPANGDVNPYGVAVVPSSHGQLTKGDVLVSNFNNAGNEQGTGTTIVEVSPGGQQKLFATIPAKSGKGGVGLTTALVALRSGWVIVGSLPTADGRPRPCSRVSCSCWTPPARYGKSSAGLTQGGKFVAVKDVDKKDPPGGALFGLAATASPRQVYFVNDDTNTLNVLRAP